MFRYDDTAFDRSPERNRHPLPTDPVCPPSIYDSAEPVERPTCPPRNATEAAIENAFCFDGPPDSLVTIAGKTYLYFAGNGYLGLQADPEILAASCEATLRYGVGTATTRTAFTAPPVFEVERRVADLLGMESALYTASGYVANQILLESLEGTFDRLFIDESAHYSLFDAAKRLRGARSRPTTFKHRDLDDLRDKLDGNLQFHERPLVVTDGVFSLLGTVAPVPEYMELLSHYDDSSLWIDDAQGFGVLGKNGLGTLEHFGIDSARANRTAQDQSDRLSLDGVFAEFNTEFDAESSQNVNEPRLYLSFSLSKGVGGSGGAIPGSATFIQRIKDRCGVFFGASAPANPIAAATAKALAILADDFFRGKRREKLRENTALLKDGLQRLGLETGHPDLPMAILTLGSSKNMRRIQRELSEQGILVSYLPRYAGLGSEGALRMAVFATHTPEMISELLDTLAQVIR